MKGMRMMFLVLALVLVASLVVGLFTPAKVEASATRIDVIYRGQERGWFLSPGDTLVVFYYPDGRPSTVEWKQPFLSYLLNGRPFVVGSIYWSRYTVYSGATLIAWMHLYNGSVDGLSQHFSLPYGGGVYKFVIQAPDKSAQVTVKVY
ncbi:MAG: hypothetical protein COX34_01825 [Candidatus Nealsonbacteria bacterium CG23_combo_of_CG06-09_8_20_14_all_36_12]|uniref:Uncharacterized protein n=1 Tax=Candidatus Nealsonbacteria bacterium CG23_combo_of_CG06-09_8_20_14_all_36_12 TaxID=1974718 RepID=A0A2G9Z067_9BACT|nr:MAG: hypothetical protein COX34_01825 [Candidatus Nealsonbacteria bacterium CG23_combo_of_CG06-09_8_20_14_all_36_12]